MDGLTANRFTFYWQLVTFVQIWKRLRLQFRLMVPDNASISNTALPDEFWMEQALRAATHALDLGEIPIGAVVVCKGKIVGRGWNSNLTNADPSAHAEIMALREAGKNIANHRLVDCAMFVTLEPCAMCAGALIHARLARLVYGAADPKAGAVHSVMSVLNHPKLNHQMEVREGVLADKCSELLQAFFKARRAAKSASQPGNLEPNRDH